MSEIDLLKTFLTYRSEEAFAELVRRYAGLVYSVAKRRANNAAMAEDITQIVFIRFAKMPPKLNSHAELAAWLHRTTVNVTIDMWRSETRRRNREQEAIAMETITTENALWEDISPSLDEALNQLNDDDRRALLLRFFSGKTMRELGAALGVSEDAAKMRVSRAVDRLRLQLGVRSAACSAAALAGILAERSVDAAPIELVSKLSAMELPAVAVAGGLIGALLGISRFKLAAGAVGLVVIGVLTFHLLHPGNKPGTEEAMANRETNLLNDKATMASTERRASRSFDESISPPKKEVKIVFHVLDSETGRGLADSKIRESYFGVGGIGEGHDLYTDNKGDAAVLAPDDPAKSAGLNLFVTAEGHVPKVVGFNTGTVPAEYTMKLDPAMTIGGTVINEQGQPVAGVKIWVQGPGNKTDQIENVDFQTCPVTNHDDGSWSCSYIPRDWTDEIRLILKKPGYAVTLPDVPMARVDLKNLVLVIDRGYTVTGQITDSQNDPIPNASINTIDGDSSKRQSTVTDESGVYTLVGVPGDVQKGSYYVAPNLETNASGVAMIRGLITHGNLQVELAVQADGFAPRTNIVALLQTTNTTNLTLSPGNVFRGRVLDEAGNPIPYAVVQTDWDNQGERRFAWTTHTDENGRFVWNSAPAEETLYWFEANGYNVIRDMPLVADGSEYEITLKSSVAK